MREYQIGVMGSVADMDYAKELENASYKMGQLIAERGGTLLFGADKDSSLISTAAARGAKSKNGLVIGITSGQSKEVQQDCADVILPTGLERGTGREFVLVLGCEAIIAASGGSDTLTELAVAYQAGIPTIGLTGFGGWTDRLAGHSLDTRERQELIATSTPEIAVDTAFQAAATYRQQNRPQSRAPRGIIFEP